MCQIGFSIGTYSIGEPFLSGNPDSEGSFSVVTGVYRDFFQNSKLYHFSPSYHYFPIKSMFSSCFLI